MDFEYRISMQSTYFALCLRQISDFEEIDKKLSDVKSQEVSPSEAHFKDMNINMYTERREQLLVAPVVSAALTLEAFSYDYAATHLGDSFVKNHIDKLDVPSRLVVASKIVTGVDFPVDGKIYEEMKRLVRLRNKLVHFKSRKFTGVANPGAEQFRREWSSELESVMYSSVNMLRQLMKELDRIHGEKGLYEYSLEPTECFA